MGKWRDAATDKQRADADVLGFDLDKQFEIVLDGLAVNAVTLKLTKAIGGLAKLPPDAQADAITAACDTIRGFLTPEMHQAAMSAALSAVPEMDKAALLAEKIA